MQVYIEKSATNILICAPTKPVSKELRRRISEIICDVEEIREAHLPDVITIGSDTDASRVLFLVFDQQRNIPLIMKSIGAALADMARDEEQFEVWPIGPSSELLKTIRDSNCVVGWRD